MNTWKKAGFGIITNWIEVSFVMMLLGGFVLGKLIVDAAFSYFLVLAVGLTAGRLAYMKRENDPLPFEVISVAFLVGFLFGHRVGSGILLTAVFAAGWLACYKAHQKFEFLA